MIFIDFETRSQLDIRKVGAWRYSEHPSTEPLCMAFALDDNPVDIWIPGEGMPDELHAAIQNDHIVEAHNAFFERAIWRNIMIPFFKWIDIPDEQWACSASRAAAHALPRSLDGAGSALALDVQKNLDGKRVMMKVSRPRNLKNLDDPKDIWHSNRKDFETLYQYCKDDVDSERAISHSLRDLSPKEREIWLLDQKINERGIRVDLPAVHAALYIAEQYKKKQTRRLKELTNNYVSTALQTGRLLKWVQQQGCDLENLQKGTLTEYVKLAIPTKVKEVLDIRLNLSKTSTAKYSSILNAICSDDRLRDLLMYHGASTGRWTGKLVQPQNFPRNDFEGDLETYFELLKSNDLEAFEMCYPDVMQTISKCIRGVFIPSEGHHFFGGDYAAIEARVLLWLAKDFMGLHLFRNNEDLYVDLARYIYRKQDINKIERQLGKQAILGCGYGMGKAKFKDTCARYGLNIAPELADEAVDKYRQKYKSVVHFWYDQENTARCAVERPNNFFKSGRVGWGTHKDFLFCKLPSGRCLAYYQPKIEWVDTPWGEKKESITYMSINSVTRKWERTKTYGGKLAENITQATARDLMADAMLRCEKAGYKVVMSVHDELITEKENGSVAEFEELMSTLPKWAERLPIQVEGWKGRRYLK